MYAVITLELLIFFFLEVLSHKFYLLSPPRDVYHIVATIAPFGYSLKLYFM